MEKSGEYEAVIGLEVHIQMNTLSKAFCSDDASYGGDPNTHVSAISLAHPGTLPRPNRQHVEKAVKLGLALGCDINPLSYYDRKHYFYADLPKGFQTTQDGSPICLGGTFTVTTKAGERKIRIHHIHMEEDAGKSIHDPDSQGSLLDFNRAGVPLLEMVTEPDFRSSEEVYQFITELRQLVQYLDVSDGNMEEGSLRCDCNISVRPQGFDGLNPRCEVKNINSARYARKAVDYEIKRQIRKLRQGHTVAQQTREFIPDQGITKLLRDKEDAHDYRYLPEPDIPPIEMTESTIERIRRELPMLPHDYRSLFETKYDISPYDSNIITEVKSRAAYFKQLLESMNDVPSRSLSKLYINKILPYLDENGIEAHTFPLSVTHLEHFLQLIENNEVSSSIAYQKLWPALLDSPQDVRQLMDKLNLGQTSDQDLILQIAREVIDQHPEQVTKYMRGKKGVSKFFMGQVMKKSRGKANPQMANEVVLNILEELANHK